MTDILPSGKASKKRILVFLFRFFFVLILLEAGLRVSGFAFIAQQDYKNRISDSGNYSILAIGDSTTANVHNGQGSWPEELEILLNNRSEGKRFRVFNIGRPSLSTSEMMSELKSNLDKYNPDMVAAMIGGVDDGTYVMRNETSTKKTDFIKDLRVYKLAFFAARNIKQSLSGNYDEAESEYSQPAEKTYEEKENAIFETIGKNSINTTGLIELITLYVHNGKKQELSALVDNLKEKVPRNDSRALFFLGYKLFDLKEYDAAEKLVKKSIEFNETELTYYITLAAIYDGQGRYKEAINLYRGIYIVAKEQRNSYNEHILIQIANLNMRINASQEAYEILSVIVRLNSKKTQELFWLGELSEKLNKSDESALLFESIIKKNPENYAAYSELAWFYLNNNRSIDATLAFNNIYRINPRYLIEAYERIAGRYREKGMHDEAEKMLTKASELRAEYFDSTTKDNYLELYRLLNERGIQLVIVQYPQLEVDKVKMMFRGDEEIIFVSNEENFRQALESSPYKDYFLGDAQPPVDHPTKKGHKLIAEAVADAISGLV